MFKSSSSRARQTHAVIALALCKQAEPQTNPEDRGHGRLLKTPPLPWARLWPCGGFGFLSPHSEDSGWTLSKDTAMSRGSLSSQVHCQPRLVEFTIRRGRGIDVNCLSPKRKSDQSQLCKIVFVTFLSLFPCSLLWHQNRPLIIHRQQLFLPH